MRRIDEGLVQTVALSLWLGAAGLFVSSVAPAAFAVLPTRTLAGAIVGRVLPALFYAGIAVGIAVVILEVFAGRSMVGRRGLSATVMVAACAIAHFWIDSRIARLRIFIGGSLESLAATDPLRIVFGRLHVASVALLGVAMLAAAVALVMAMRALQPKS
jgi:hypothetical protein